MPKPTLAQLEAVVTRQHLAAAPGTKDRCYTALMLVAIRRCRREQANSGEDVTRVVSSPVGVSACVETEGVSAEASALSVPPDDSRPELFQTGSPLLDSLPLSSETPGASAPKPKRQPRRQGQRA